MDDATLLEQFESCALPFERWSHRMHLRVAYLYLRSHPFDQALRRMRAGIQAYNRANRVPDGLESGYHETLTVAWLRVIDSHLRESAPDSDPFLEAHADLLDRRLLRRFYSRERLVSWEAKRGFVEPDLAALPSGDRTTR